MTRQRDIDASRYDRTDRGDRYDRQDRDDRNSRRDGFDGYFRNWRDNDRRDNSFWGYKNYGQYRSAQVHRRNAERKADRYYDRNYGGYYDDDHYDRYNWFEDRVVRNVIYNRIFNDYSYTPLYQSIYSYSDPYDHYDDYDNYDDYYDIDSYYGAPINYAYYGIPYDPYYGYVPAVTYYVPQYGQVYYQQPDYYTGYYPTYSSGGYPYGYANYNPTYSNYGYGDDYGYYDNGNGYYEDPYGYGNGGGGLGDVIGQLTGNSFLGELLSGFLVQGYDQGYTMGQLARDNGYDDENYYYDPYAVNASYYDTYSINLAENRRIFSEGYEAGYRDAMMSREDDYMPYYDSQPDLISLLAGNLLGSI